MNLMDCVRNGLVYFDGGLGTLLQSKGLPAGHKPECWNIEKPNIIVEVHKQYLQSGANILDSNTFGANRLRFPDKTGEYSLENIITKAILSAKQAIKELHLENSSRFVALSVGPCGKLLAPYGDLPFEEAVSIFSEVVKYGATAGADCILIETMTDAYETKAAVLAAKESCSLPVFVTNTYDENAQLLTGASPEVMVALLEGLHVDALGINCGFGPKAMKPIVKRLYEASSTPVIVNPNAGLPKVIDGNTTFDVSPDEFAQDMIDIVNLGARIIGGCCGTTPEHIAKVKDFTVDLNVLPVVNRTNTVVTSYSQTVQFGDETIVIGERINPTGKPKLKEALRNRDFSYILQEATTQKEKGAHILDVNVGLPEINESEVFSELLPMLQSIINLPLQIDSSDPEALEKALRIYNGKALVNSVNGKQSNMDAVLPIVAKYGGVVIALTLDESGIPNTPEERVMIAEKIRAEAHKYGIQDKDIIVDPLTMAVSVDLNAAKITLEAVSGVRSIGLLTSLGVSNVSFGLPNREAVNTAFFDTAISYGLNAAILNPYSNAMMDKALNHNDLSKAEKYKNFTDVIANQTTLPTVSNQERATLTLMECIIKGLKDLAAENTKKLLTNVEPMEIINQHIIPALDNVGKDFEKKLVFLPQLLASADAAQVSFTLLKEYYKEHHIQKEEKGQVIMATVEGDVHDIGKNIVCTLLENYGYTVHDLGKDVPSEKIVSFAKDNNILFIGLSALMTTTVPSMEKTIEMLKKETPNCYVVVGGAVLNQEYADQIHADAYAKDAMETVRLAESFFS